MLTGNMQLLRGEGGYLCWVSCPPKRDEYPIKVLSLWRPSPPLTRTPTGCRPHGFSHTCFHGWSAIWICTIWPMWRRFIVLSVWRVLEARCKFGGHLQTLMMMLIDKFFINIMNTLSYICLSFTRTASTVTHNLHQFILIWYKVTQCCLWSSLAQCNITLTTYTSKSLLVRIINTESTLIHRFLKVTYLITHIIIYLGIRQRKHHP